MQMPSMEQMKAMADRKVEPLLAQLKSDPKNKDLSSGRVFYKSAHQFKDAAAYFDRALQVDAKNVSVRTNGFLPLTTTGTSTEPWRFCRNP